MALNTEITFFDENGNKMEPDEDGMISFKPSTKIVVSVKIPRRYISISIPCWYRNATHVARNFHNKKAIVPSMNSHIGHRMGFKNYTRVGSFK